MFVIIAWCFVTIPAFGINVTFAEFLELQNPDYKWHIFSNKKGYGFFKVSLEL